MLQDWLSNHALVFVQNHQQWILGLVAGAIVSHPGTCAVLLFNALTRIPGVGYYIGTHPDDAIEWADNFDKTINACVRKYAKEHAAAAATPPPPPAPAA